MKKLLYLILFVFALNISNSHSQNSTEKMINMGIGIGAHYGFWGGNLAITPIENLSAFVAYGLMPEYIPRSPSNDLKLENMNQCWSIGIKYYLLSADYQLRPRISIHYGLNSITEHQKVHESGRIIGSFYSWGQGYSLGAGISWMLLFDKSLGLDFDLSYAITTEPYIASWKKITRWEYFFPMKDKSPYYFSIGLRYGFNLE